MTPHITILGGGAIGCFLGLALASGDVRVTVLARPPITSLYERGLLHGRRIDGARVAPSTGLRVVSSMDDIPSTDGVLITTKARDLRPIADAWRAAGRSRSVPVWGLQNGMQSQRVLTEAGIEDPRAGSVTFNVVRGADRFTQTTSGVLMLPRTAGCFVTAAIVNGLQRAAVGCREVPDIDAALRGKLILNLNNGICASTGLSIKASVLNHDARRCFRLAVKEALTVFRIARRSVARVGRIPPSLLPFLLPLPTQVITRLAPAFIKIDPNALSSTLQDLLAGRTTEVRTLHGEIGDVARGFEGVSAPVNDHIVHTVERIHDPSGHPSFVAPAALLAELNELRRAQL